jgi:hypothetical protein
MYADHVDPDVAFKAIAPKDEDDFLAWSNSVWGTAGIVTPSDHDAVDRVRTLLELRTKDSP